MKTIQKYTLTTDKEKQTLSFKAGFRIVRIEYLVTEKRICLWAEVPLRADIPEIKKTFSVIKSHQPVATEYQYIDTAIDLLKPDAFHIYEIPENKKLQQAGWSEWEAEAQNKPVAA